MSASYLQMRNSTGSTSSSPNQSEDRPVKRHRTRTGIACESCQRRKTRCELLNGESTGCHRCHVLGTACSLNACETGGDATPGAADAHQLRVLDERTERIEAALNRVLSKGGSSGGVVELQNDLRDTPQRDGGIGSMVLRAFGQGMTSRWMDPIKLGLVMDRQMEQCVQQYFTQTAILFPVDSIESLISAHSSHPLVRTVILILTMPHLRQRLHKVLQANLGVADSTPPTMSTFIGYMILSHIPQVKDELVTSIDVHCAAMRGMGQALAIGLDDTVHAITQPGFDWTIETECIDRLAALYVTAHRLAWTQLFSTPGFTHQSSLPLLINVLPIPTAYQLRSHTLLHLTLESKLLLLLDPVIHVYRRVRLARTFNQESIDALSIEFRNFQDSVAQWRTDVEFNNLSSSSYLLYHSHLVESLLALTLSGIYIPTPVAVTDRMTILTGYGGHLLHSSLRLIDHVLKSNLDIALVPSFHLVLALLPLGALVQSGKLRPTEEEVTSRQTKLEEYKRVLSRSHPKLSLIIQDIDNMDPPHDYSQLTTTRQTETDALPEAVMPGWDMGFDQLFDMDALWPLLGDWANNA